MPSSKPASLSVGPNEWEELVKQLNLIISDIYNLLDYALGKDSKGVTITLEHGGLGQDVSEFSGLVQITGGASEDVSVGTGLQISSGALKIKNQDAEPDLTETMVADAAALSPVVVVTGSDSINMTAFNADLATMVSEIDALKDKINSHITETNLHLATVNNVLAKLRLAEVLDT